MRRIKVVDSNEPGEHHEVGFAEAAQQMISTALADGAVAIMVVWETPAGYKYGAVPYSHAVLRGLSDQAYSEMWIKSEEVDDE